MSPMSVWDGNFFGSTDSKKGTSAHSSSEFKLPFSARDVEQEASRNLAQEIYMKEYKDKRKPGALLELAAEARAFVEVALLEIEAS